MRNSRVSFCPPGKIINHSTSCPIIQAFKLLIGLVCSLKLIPRSYVKRIKGRVPDMRIIVDINHPAHVHYFKNFVWEMGRRGHELLITASKKDISTQLLRLYDIDYYDLGSYGSSVLHKIVNIPLMDIKMCYAAKNFRPDIFIGFASTRIAHASKLIGVPSIIFDDTEHAAWEHRLYVPYSDAILTPNCFDKDLGKKQTRFNGYMELAYLHPNQFTPNPAVLGELGLTENDRFIMVRFVSWQAGHDVGHHGIRDKVEFVKQLQQYGKVLITSEGPLPPELRSHQVRVSPEKLHDLLYYSTLYVGEGGTTASEAATLGTNAIHISTTAKYCGVFQYLNKHGLLWLSENDEEALNMVANILRAPNCKDVGRDKRNYIINNNIDVTAFMVWFIENYPGSVDLISESIDSRVIF